MAEDKIRVQVYYYDKGAFRKQYIQLMSRQEINEMNVSSSRLMGIALSEDDPFGHKLPETIQK